MQEESRLAYSLALELAKQLIVLSTGVLALMVALTKDIFKQTPSKFAASVLVLSWFCYLGAIWHGVRHIQSLTGNLEWAAIERTAVVAEKKDSMVSALAATYLAAASDTATSDSLTNRARDRLADLGILIGQSAKQDARLQIRYFMVGTAVAMFYGFLMLVQNRKQPSPE